MTERTTRAELDAAFRRYARAYTAAGIGAADAMTRPDYRPTGLDLILERPSTYATGGVWLSPWHNPVTPQRWDGASAHWTPRGVNRFGGGTMREARALLLAGAEALEAAIAVHGPSTHPADVAALAHLDAERDARTERELAQLRADGLI